MKPDEIKMIVIFKTLSMLRAGRSRGGARQLPAGGTVPAASHRPAPAGT